MQSSKGAKLNDIAFYIVGLTERPKNDTQGTNRESRLGRAILGLVRDIQLGTLKYHPQTEIFYEEYPLFQPL